MASVVAEFLQVIGVDSSAPSTMQELIPYLLTVFIGVFLVSIVFCVFGRILEAFLNWSRWK